jgi:hypothetical protein
MQQIEINANILYFLLWQKNLFPISFQRFNLVFIPGVGVAGFFLTQYTSILRPSKIYSNWDFWFENKPPGNPAWRVKKILCAGKILHFILRTTNLTWLERRKWWSIWEPPTTSCINLNRRKKAKLRKHFYESWIVVRPSTTLTVHLYQKLWEKEKLSCNLGRCVPLKCGFGSGFTLQAFVGLAWWAGKGSGLRLCPKTKPKQALTSGSCT